jgi:hypothetical protein
MMDLLILFVLQSMAGAGWTARAGRRMNGLASPAVQNEPVDEQDHDRPHDGRKKSGSLIFRPVPVHGAPDETGQQRTGDSEENGDDASARVLAGHQQLRNAARKQTDHNPGEDSVFSQHNIQMLPVAVLTSVTICLLYAKPAFAGVVLPLVEKPLPGRQAHAHQLPEVSY